jgi:hypothetical protein
MTTSACVFEPRLIVNAPAIGQRSHSTRRVGEAAAFMDG